MLNVKYAGIKIKKVTLGVGDFVTIFSIKIKEK